MIRYKNKSEEVGNEKKIEKRIKKKVKIEKRNKKGR